MSYVLFLLKVKPETRLVTRKNKNDCQIKEKWSLECVSNLSRLGLQRESKRLHGSHLAWAFNSVSNIGEFVWNIAMKSRFNASLSSVFFETTIEKSILQYGDTGPKKLCCATIEFLLKAGWQRRYRGFWWRVVTMASSSAAFFHVCMYPASNGFFFWLLGLKCCDAFLDKITGRGFSSACIKNGK